MRVMLSLLALLVIFLITVPGCGKKEADPAVARDWLEAHAEDIKGVEGLINGYFAVTYAAEDDDPHYLVKGHLEDQLDLKIVKEGLEKLNPPLPLQYNFE